MSRLNKAALGLGVTLLGLVGGCIVDEGDKRCGPNMVLVDGEGTLLCECAPTAILDEANGGCIACGANEEASDQNQCVCIGGFARGSDGVCAKSEQGAPCTSDAQCSGSFPHCVVSASGGYCTSQGCKASSECARGYLCDDDGAKSVCKKTPAGYGMSCSAPADCASTEAKFCESFVSKTCLVTCDKDNPCPGDWACCDVTIAKLCVPPEGLTGGMCPNGGKLITP